MKLTTLKLNDRGKALFYTAMSWNTEKKKSVPSVLYRLDYYNALLAGVLACTTKPQRIIQNAAARVVFKKPKRAHVTS